LVYVNTFEVNRMNTEITNEIREDFLRWSGGWPPASKDEIKIYVKYARQARWDREEVRAFLILWMISDARKAERRRIFRVISSTAVKPFFAC